MSSHSSAAPLLCSSELQPSRCAKPSLGKPSPCTCSNCWGKGKNLIKGQAKYSESLASPCATRPERDLNFICGGRFCSRLCDDACSAFCKLRRVLDLTSYQSAKLRKVRQDRQDHKSKVQSSVSLCSLAAWRPSQNHDTSWWCPPRSLGTLPKWSPGSAPGIWPSPRQ